MCCTSDVAGEPPCSHSGHLPMSYGIHYCHTSTLYILHLLPLFHTHNVLLLKHISVINFSAKRCILFLPRTASKLLFEMYNWLNSNHYVKNRCTNNAGILTVNVSERIKQFQLTPMRVFAPREFKINLSPLFTPVIFLPCVSRAVYIYTQTK